MLLESIFIIVSCLFIAVLFYKQANEQIEILTVDADRIQNLPNWLAERSPVVVRGYKTPSLGTRAACEQRPSLAPLFQYDTTSFPIQTRKALAQESGLDIWFEHTLIPILTSRISRLYTTPHSRMIIGKQGLSQTTAPITFFMPTQGAFTVNILVQSQIPFLPSRWEGRALESLTVADSPLLNQIQYSQLKVRPGHLLFLPPHILIDIQEDTTAEIQAWGYFVELHHPISLAVDTLQFKQ